MTTNETFLLLIRAEDGAHPHVYRTEADALAALTDQLGYAPASLMGRHYDDWGRSLSVERRPANWSATKERRLATAYDRREMGLALSAAQRAILADFGVGA